MSQEDKNIKKNSIKDKLSTIKYNCDIKSHLRVNQEICKNCQKRYCTYICPAGVYSYDDEKNVLNVEHENCLECGACRISCPNEALEWEYPSAQNGVIYKNS